MVTKTTNNVEVIAYPYYAHEYSSPIAGIYQFHYKIDIVNHNGFSVKLQSRVWNIYDAEKGRRLVEGVGVVGQQPLIAPGETFSYLSGCQLEAPIGTMEGFYCFTKVGARDVITVHTPRMVFCYPPLNN
jgi:ApaG protein